MRTIIIRSYLYYKSICKHSYLSIFHLVNLGTDINQLHEVVQTEVHDLDVPEHFLVNFSTDVLGIEVKRLLSDIVQQDDCFANELFLNFKVCEVRKELKSVFQWSVTRVLKTHIRLTASIKSVESFT